MRHLVLVFALCGLVTACAAPSVDQPATSTTSSVATTPAPAPTTTIAPTTTTSRPPGPPVAWIAPSGVTLAVVSADGGTVRLLSPCGEPATLEDGSPVYDVDVIVDPGHGGPVDTGAVAPTGLAEKEVNLRVGQKTAEILEERGIGTALTRSGDYPIPIRTRVEFAHLMDAALLISIHHNAPTAPASDVPGVEIFVQHDSEESQRLGGLLYDASMAALDGFEVDWDRADDAGVMSVINSDGNDAYGMVRLPEIPSALVELGYIANRAESELYQHPDYVPTAAAALADAVEKFLTTTEEGSGLVEGRTFNPSAGVGRDQCVEPDLELALYPDVVDVVVEAGDGGYTFAVTVSSTYDSPERYADAFRVIGDDGQVYGVRELTHDHANEQPFTRTLGAIELPATVGSVTVEARDQVYGWGGDTMVVELP